MLQLQRASAGSGKTYTLAKKFIWFLIAVHPQGKKWRLRTPKEITDGLPRILAITFTNKATNEMKQRIVERLADLSLADGTENVSSERIGKIPYLKEFSSELGTGIREIGVASRIALSVLLNDYSDFKVSTIDSFFQTVLRTFAYESNLNDAYQVEIDTEFLATAAVDTTLDHINNSADTSSSFWMTELMRTHAADGKTTWNVFQKSEQRESIYYKLRNSLLRLENEDFKDIRNQLDEYFDTPDGSDPLKEAYLIIKAKLHTPLKEAFDEARNNASRLTNLLKECGLDPKEHGHRYLAGHLEKLKRLRFDLPSRSSSKDIFTPLNLDKNPSVLKKNVAAVRIDEINDTAARMYEAYSKWLELRSGKEWQHWSLYSPLIPYLGMLGEARKNMREYLDSNNTIQLGETNSMLRMIIGDDDAPFIYERLGSAIDHYLIDEFQDTSRMQWDNLRPLLGESISRGEDNLIIGDAKQSIYRFRNADPSLITTHVPASFTDRQDAGLSKEDNTNWRSDRTIVEFNNFFFHTLASQIAEEGQGTIDFGDLYRNVAQYPSHRKREGYVEINFLSAPPKEEMAPGEDKLTKSDYLRKLALTHIPSLIVSLLERGFRQQDIALLVRTNDLAKEVIATLVGYNSSLKPGERRIEFISEESLLVSSSEAVGIIISVLRQMVAGTDMQRDNQDERRHRPMWNDIKCNFSFYALRHPELSTAEQVKAFLEDDSPTDAIDCMLAGMQTVALPALVEAITENFVSQDMRETQAVFISALQDMVLEYCDRYASDVASFIEWWDAKGALRSISSPEGTDAVQVMTVHKSKGLEFKCVIIPYDNSPLPPPAAKSEWKWVAPSDYLAFASLPPYLPISTTSALIGSDHEEVWTRYFDLYMMDSLNSSYVAFTRAVSELYIFTALPEKPNTKSLGGYLFDICNEADTYLDSVGDPTMREYMLPDGLAEWNDSHDAVSFGSKAEVVKSDEITSGDALVIPEYAVDSSPAILRYVEGDDTTGDTLMPEEEDNDPRSEGNLLHAVMAGVKSAADIPRSILNLKMRGMITSAQAAQWEPFLMEAVSKQPVAGWFHPAWKVLTERSILRMHSSIRPDRVMISPDGRSAVVIDYKFGTPHAGNDHIKQVKEYISCFSEASGIRNVTGFVWYVKADKIVPVA